MVGVDGECLSTTCVRASAAVVDVVWISHLTPFLLLSLSSQTDVNILLNAYSYTSWSNLWQFALSIVFDTRVKKYLIKHFCKWWCNLANIVLWKVTPVGKKINGKITWLFVWNYLGSNTLHHCTKPCLYICVFYFKNCSSNGKPPEGKFSYTVLFWENRTSTNIHCHWWFFLMHLLTLQPGVTADTHTNMKNGSTYSITCVLLH